MSSNIKRGGNPPISDEDLQKTVEVYVRCGFNVSATGRDMGLSRRAVQKRLDHAKDRGILPDGVVRLPANAPNKRPVIELIDQQKKAFARKRSKGTWRKPRDIELHYEGPFMVILFGDKHVDDDGTDLETLDYWIDHLDAADRRYGIALGDWSNNWLRFLGFLYSDQETSKDEGWELVKHYIDKMGPDLLAGCGGNHDNWNDGIRLMHEMMARHQVVHEADALRIRFKQKGVDKPITIGIRHNFPGNSIYNPVHGVMRSAIFGWRDTILAGGDKHISGHASVKDPDTGFLTRCEQVASFKLLDRYADEKGFMDKHVTPAVAYVLRPWFGEDDPRRAVRFEDPADARAFLDQARLDFEG